MAKDYFQDILPPQDNRTSTRARVPRAAAPHPQPVDLSTKVSETDDEDTVMIPQQPLPEQNPGRSIRNISAPTRRMRDDSSAIQRSSAPKKVRPSIRMGIWIVAGAAFLVATLLLSVAMRDTIVTVVPRTQSITFDETARFTAVLGEESADSSLTYALQTFSIEESVPVQSSGTTRVEDKAQGEITVFNNASAAPYRLIKNTRFETSEGLVYRAESDIVIPGKTASAPGQIVARVIADQAGERHNISSGKLSLPGLSGGKDFSNIYAEVRTHISGGFVGDRPIVSDADQAQARSLIRSALEKRIRDDIAKLSTDEVVAFPDLAQVQYTELPRTVSEGSTRMAERADVAAVLMRRSSLAREIARKIAADSESTSVEIRVIQDFAAIPRSSSSTPGIDPLELTLSGRIMLVWGVNSAELSEALAGRDQSAFQTIVTGFSGIESATARIQPFWSDSFPGRAKDIRIEVEEPTSL
jgi:hypothetical protein